MGRTAKVSGTGSTSFLKHWLSTAGENVLLLFVREDV